jgi:hypothetical protein
MEITENKEQSPEETPVHLFVLPEYHQATGKFIYYATQALMRAKNPVLREISTEYVDHVPVTQATVSSGEVVESQPIEYQMIFEFSINAVVNGDFDNLNLAIDQASDVALSEQMHHLYKYMGRVCDAEGNSIDAKGQPLSYELMLQMAEKVDMTFDENGNPQHRFVAHPSMVEQFKSLPPQTEEQRRAWDEMVERKRQEFNARKRHRKLS